MEAATNQACCVMSQPIDADENYIFFALMCSKKHIISMAVGGGQPNISQELVRSLRLPHPPIIVQQQIADYLGTRCAELDRVVSANNAVIDKLKEYRQSLIYEAVTGKIAV